MSENEAVVSASSDSANGKIRFGTMMSKQKAAILAAALAAAVLIWLSAPVPQPERWSESEAALIASLSLSALPPPRPDPSNAVADDERAAMLGQRLFFDPRLSANGAVSCASCHRPELAFSDGLPIAVGIGPGRRHTPGLLGLAHSPWFYWDGRRDSQWAQALTPLETHFEQGVGRAAIVRLLATEPDYKPLYEEIFGALPDPARLPDSASPRGGDAAREAWRRLDADSRFSVSSAFANAGKALAAYQRTLLPSPARFDAYADALARDGATRQRRQGDTLDQEEIAGLALFIGEAQCVNCHNGPLFTNHEFHNTGIPPLSGELPSLGRFDGVRLARGDPFNCLGAFSDAAPGQCAEMRFAKDDGELAGAHKTPGLRNVALTAPYMHTGQIATLARVLRHYNEAPTAMLGHNEAKPLGLSRRQLRQLEAFLHALAAAPP